MYNKIDVTSPVRKFQNPIKNCFNSSASAEAANAFSVWKRKKDVEILNALTREEAFPGEENVFWIDDENDDDDFFAVSLSTTKSSPDFDDLEETKTLALVLLLPMLVVLFEEAAMQKLEELHKANMMR